MPNELTNPNNVVTEERLAQFYQQILPYLGGMPDVLANKFNRADLYSTDEKLIGRWIDGKPLYQKTVTIDSLPNVTTTEYDVGLTNVSYVNISGYVLFPSGNKTSIPYVDVTNVNSSIEFQGNVNGKVAVAVRADRRTCSAVLTLQYTKTTDSAVEIGSDTDYSTTEKIVGTWIDGKPIWQKTISCTTPNAVNTMTNIADLSSLNIDTVCEMDGMFMDGSAGSAAHLPVNYYLNANNYAMCHVSYASSSHYLSMQIGLNDHREKPAKITIQYTKTSS